MQRQPLIILTGPTAVGKTALSIGLAKALNGEIISADSMQVYRHMDIGSAKITSKEMDGVSHHLIDVLDPTIEFNVATFQSKCRQYMKEIYSRSKIPILVGGTGFYIQSVLYSVDFSQTETDNLYRKELADFAKHKGNEALHARLMEIDKKSADAIHPNNVKRVIRALEYYKQTGHKISEHNEEQHKKESDYQFRYYVLSLPREILYERINRRVDLMKEEGLTKEVKSLLEMGCTRDMVSMQGLGYKEIIDALEGRDTLDHAYERIKQETRHFAKRQFTWFRRERDVTWLEKEKFADEEALLRYCINDCKEYLKIEK